MQIPNTHYSHQKIAEQKVTLISSREIVWPQLQSQLKVVFLAIFLVTDICAFLQNTQ